MKKSYYSYRLFHFMLLTFIAFHMLVSSPGWTQIGNEFLNPSNEFFLFTNVLVLIFMVLSFLKPDKIIYLVLTISSLTLVKLDAMPLIPNHIVFALIVFFTILCSLPLYWDKNLEIHERLGTWYEKVAPYIRVELLLLYFFVVFHKLNHDYFNPDVSCGSLLYQEIAAVYQIFPTGSWINSISLWGALGFEILIPILLFFKRTRVLGVLAGLVFHFLLSFHPELYILSFSAELYALYVLFLPKDLIEKIWLKATNILQSNRIRRFMLYGGISLLVILMIYIFSVIQTSGIREGFKQVFGLVPVAWYLWNLALIIGFITIARPSLISADNDIFQLKWSPLLIFPLLVFFNGMTPYIGLKTSTNFAMFSNLKVDGKQNNHWFMTSEYQLADYQNDTVTIVETSHPDLQNFIEWDERIPYFTLRKIVSQHNQQKLQLTYRKGEQLYNLTLPDDHNHEAATAPSWLAKKLLIFRGIPKEGPTPCQW